MALTAPTTQDVLEGEPVTAVTYQRVSTQEQAAKGGHREGFSIPAQRIGNTKKADDLGAVIVEEFVDAGYSARTMNRPDLQRMLEYIMKRPGFDGDLFYWVSTSWLALVVSA